MIEAEILDLGVTVDVLALSSQSDLRQSRTVALWNKFPKIALSWQDCQPLSRGPIPLWHAKKCFSLNSIFRKLLAMEILSSATEAFPRLCLGKLLRGYGLNLAVIWFQGTCQQDCWYLWQPCCWRQIASMNSWSLWRRTPLTLPSWMWRLYWKQKLGIVKP